MSRVVIMKKKYVVIILLLVITIVTALSIWFNGPYASDMGNTGNWEPGYASPRQYYEEGGQKLKGITKTIDNISYTFDDFGSAIQNENSGQWIGNKFQLDTGIMLKNTWYEIDGELYYFDDEEEVVKNRFIRVNGKRYSLGKSGVLRKLFFRARLHNFGTDESGAIIEEGDFFTGGYHGSYGDYYIVYSKGHGVKQDIGAIDFVEIPTIMWNDKWYSIDKPEYFWKEDYLLVGETYPSTSGKLVYNNDSINVTQGSQIYTKGNDLEQIYIYDKTDNSFYGYVLSE